MLSDYTCCLHKWQRKTFPTVQHVYLIEQHVDLIVQHVHVTIQGVYMSYLVQHV